MPSPGAGGTDRTSTGEGKKAVFGVWANAWHKERQRGLCGRGTMEPVVRTIRNLRWKMPRIPRVWFFDSHILAGTGARPGGPRRSAVLSEPEHFC